MTDKNIMLDKLNPEIPTTATIFIGTTDNNIMLDELNTKISTTVTIFIGAVVTIAIATSVTAISRSECFSEDGYCTEIWKKLYDTFI